MGMRSASSSSNRTDGTGEAREERHRGSLMGICLEQLDQRTCFYPS